MFHIYKHISGCKSSVCMHSSVCFIRYDMCVSWTEEKWRQIFSQRMMMSWYFPLWIIERVSCNVISDNKCVYHVSLAQIRILVQSCGIASSYFTSFLCTDLLLCDIRTRFISHRILSVTSLHHIEVVPLELNENQCYAIHSHRLFHSYFIHSLVHSFYVRLVHI